MAQNTAENNRSDSRMPINLQVEVTHKNIGTVELRTLNISNGGIFVIVEGELKLPVGSCVKVKVKGTLGDGEEPPVVDMEIVRVEPLGIGLKFLLE